MRSKIFSGDISQQKNEIEGSKSSNRAEDNLRQFVSTETTCHL